MPQERHRFPRLKEGEADTYMPPKEGWTCFHCGENFKVLGAARDHFGSDPDAVAGCILKVQLGNERGMLMAMRRLEGSLQKILFALNEENWNLDQKPQDAINKVWDISHEMLSILQPWRPPSKDDR